MAKREKEHWYVLVMGNNGCVFVTDVHEHNTAEWNKKEVPKEFGKDYANQMAFGLTINGWLAFAVRTTYEVKNQPYRYEAGNFYWRRKKVKNEN